MWFNALRKILRRREISSRFLWQNENLIDPARHVVESTEDIVLFNGVFAVGFVGLSGGLVPVWRPFLFLLWPCSASRCPAAAAWRRYASVGAFDGGFGGITGRPVISNAPLPLAIAFGKLVVRQPAFHRRRCLYS
jgi:hypothetical protein